MASFPDLLLFEILIRLPVKSLVRFKFTNSHWCSLISDPTFIYAQLKRAKAFSDSCLLISCILHDDLSSTASTIHFFTFKDYYGPQVLEYSIRVSFDLYLVLPSCNGLVCFYGAHGGGIHVCNPSTKKTLRLPEKSDACSDSRLLSCGFGFDQRTCTYKVIKISGQNDHFNIEVFTMGTNNNWRTVEYNAPSFQFLNRQHPVFASGFFYWITPYSTCGSSSGFSIASFDIGSETFGFVNPPESVSSKNWHMLCLQKLEGKLCLVDIDFQLDPIPGNHRIDIWLLLSVDNWVQETIVHSSEPLDATRPVAIRGREILLHGFIKGLGYLNWYNLETGRFRRADIEGILSPYFHISDYVESLVPLNG